MNDLKLEVMRIKTGNNQMNFKIIATGYPQAKEFIHAIQLALENINGDEIETQGNVANQQSNAN